MEIYYFLNEFDCIDNIDQLDNFINYYKKNDGIPFNRFI